MNKINYQLNCWHYLTGDYLNCGRELFGEELLWETP